jgi:hypothetical protein
VGAVDALLELGISLFAARRETLEPQAECVPVDAEDHPEREEGILEREAEEVRVSEGKTPAGHGAEEFALFSPVIVDEDPEILVGKVKPEVELEVEIGEGGDIEMLHEARAEGPVGGQGNEVGLPLPEGVANLRHGNHRRAVGAVAEIDRDRVKDIAEHAWEGQEADAADGLRDSLIEEVTQDASPDGGGAVTDVVALQKAVKAGAVDLQEVQGAVDPRKLIEVDQEIEDPVEELMALRHEPPVKDGALVEAGAEGGIHGSHLINPELMNSGILECHAGKSWSRAAGAHGVALLRIEVVGMASFPGFPSSGFIFF